MKAIERISGMENCQEEKEHTRIYLVAISEETKVHQGCRQSLWGFGGSQAGLGNVGGSSLGYFPSAPNTGQKKRKDAGQNEPLLWTT